MSDPKWTLVGVKEKLARAEQNITQLQVEIDAVLGPDSSRVLGDDNQEEIQEFINGHVARRVGPRISVLAAECIHNMRSSLDQLAWQLVLAANNTPGRRNGFPLFVRDPRGNRNEQANYDACVAGMSASAKGYILALQPFQPGLGERDHKLRILHDLSVTDKHHQLVLMKNAFGANQNVRFKTTGVGLHRITVGDAKDGAIPIAVDRPIKEMMLETVVSIQIAFADFGASRLVPVTDGLWSILQATRRPLEDLAGEFSIR